jgi:adenosylmethionine-8-amino-7-oxononanoate aminotransferase
VQNAGGCFPPPPGYFQRVREICDRYDVLMVSDDVICGFGRLGEYFGGHKYGYTPDIITVAKGLTSGYGRSATSTTCCWSATRSSARSDGSGTCSGPSATATSRT